MTNPNTTWISNHAKQMAEALDIAMEAFSERGLIAVIGIFPPGVPDPVPATATNMADQHLMPGLFALCADSAAAAQEQGHMIIVEVD